MVSIIILAHKDRGYLADAIQSAINQTYPDKEVILASDGKADLKKYADRFGIGWSVTDKQSGLGANLNCALKKCKGEYVKYFADDDLLLPTCIEDMVEAIESQQADFMHSRAIIFNDRVEWDYVPRIPFPSLEQMVERNHMNGTTNFYRRDALSSGMDESLWTGEEYDLHLRLLREGKKLGYLDKPTIKYRRHANQKSLGENNPEGWRKKRTRYINSVVKARYRKHDIAVLFPTYNRQKQCADLLRQIATYDLNITVYLYDDGSYVDQLPFPEGLKVVYHKFPSNHGRKGYYKVVTKMYRDMLETHHQYYFQLADDDILVDDFFGKAIDIYQSITDKNMIALNLDLDMDRQGKRCWTNFDPYKVQFGKYSLWFTGWTDLNMMFERKFLEQIQAIEKPDPKRWVRRPSASSGVGEYVTKKVNELGLTIYQVSESLIYMQDTRSAMFDKPTHVKRLAKHRDKVIYGMASVVGREKSLAKAVASILPQCDELHVYLNQYNTVPDCLIDPKIHVYRSQEFGDNGDAGKFWACDKVWGYYFSVDDDLTYPANYTDTLIEYIEEHRRQAVVGCHGALMIQPISSYYKSRKVFHCLRTVEKAVWVHVLGTGALAYHTSTIRVAPEDFKLPNMADVWFGLLGQAQKVPMLVVPHSDGWITHNEIDMSQTIFSTKRRSHDEVTEAAKSVEWQLHYTNLVDSSIDVSDRVVQAEKGVVISTARGVDEALNTAVSIKATGPVPICIVRKDGDVIPHQYSPILDSIITATDFDLKALYELSPYKKTIILKPGTIWCSKPISGIFASVGDHPFQASVNGARDGRKEGLDRGLLPNFTGDMYYMVRPDCDVLVESRYGLDRACYETKMQPRFLTFLPFYSAGRATRHQIGQGYGICVGANKYARDYAEQLLVTYRYKVGLQ